MEFEDKVELKWKELEVESKEEKADVLLYVLEGKLVAECLVDILQLLRWSRMQNKFICIPFWWLVKQTTIDSWISFIA